MISSLLYNSHIESIPSLDLPSYLAAQTLFPKWYHRCQETKEERAAFGSFVTLPFIPAITSDIDPSLCFYGALQFPSKKADPLWNDFPEIVFFLPLYEIRQTPRATTLLSRVSFPTYSLQSAAALSKAPSLTKQKEEPSLEDWSQLLKQTHVLLKEKSFHKVVLSKKTSFSFSSIKNPFCFVSKLKEENPSTSTFAMQMTPKSLFLGSSPERLYQRKEKNLWTEAIAGTRKRALNPIEDLSLGLSLQNSAKDNEEVSYVKEFLEQQLSPLCSTISCQDKPDLISTEKLWHLRYSLQGTLQPHVIDRDLLLALHPTPAVNGTPSNNALSWIQKVEPYSRGLYAGSMGWISSKESAFTVTIRSALIQGNAFHAFSGVGIVQNSHTHLEWEELEHKLAHWMTTYV